MALSALASKVKLSGMVKSSLSSATAVVVLSALTWAAEMPLQVKEEVSGGAMATVRGMLVLAVLGSAMGAAWVAAAKPALWSLAGMVMVALAPRPLPSAQAAGMAAGLDMETVIWVSVAASALSGRS